jgi:RNA polymerase sigma-70 factor (ECF subfamily)
VYALYGDRLYKFAYHLTGNPHDSADLVQETFVRVLPKLDALDPATLDLGAYLFATERNLFLKSIERTKRQQPVEEVPEPTGPRTLEDDPQRSTLLADQQERVRRANAALAPRQRLVLALRELEDRSYAEIGELVGLKENAVAQLISRARQRLREELRLVEVDRSKLPEECQALLPLLSSYLDGQLTGVAAERTVAHLESCELCQAACRSRSRSCSAASTTPWRRAASGSGRVPCGERLAAGGRGSPREPLQARSPSRWPSEWRSSEATRSPPLPRSRRWTRKRRSCRFPKGLSGGKQRAPRGGACSSPPARTTRSTARSSCAARRPRARSSPSARPTSRAALGTRPATRPAVPS